MNETLSGKDQTTHLAAAGLGVVAQALFTVSVVTMRAAHAVAMVAGKVEGKVDYPPSWPTNGIGPDYPKPYGLAGPPPYPPTYP